ncbi:MAG: exodeoxyribonuclease VII large subunit [Pseudomonadota bacterium]
MSLIEDEPASGANTPEFTVSEISGAIKRTVESAFGHVRIRGELGRVSRHRSGHVYLDLKDDRAVLSGVIWKGTAARLSVNPQEGDEVIATGRLTTFPGQSRYQIVIEDLAYAGQGALLAKLERLKKALAAEGLFAEERKRPLPYLPRVIGVVTSPTGAVIRDILHRLADRFPVHVLVWPVAVQGPACAGEVARAVRGFDRLGSDLGEPVPRPDLLIVARGGGSVEDLWGFNEEAVVRAVADCRIPVISAVGHETDTTLIDYAADRRAPTPTGAAEMAVPVRAELVATLASLEARRMTGVARSLEERRRRIGDLARGLPRPQALLELPRQRLDLAVARLPTPARLIGDAATVLERLATRLPAGLRERIKLAERAVAARTGGFGPWLLRGRTQRSGERLGDTARRLAPAMERTWRARADRLAALARLLSSLGYRQTLARGYAVIRTAEGTVQTRAAGIAVGTALEIELQDGRLPAQAASTDAPRTEQKPKSRKQAPRTTKTDKTGQGSLF